MSGRLVHFEIPFDDGDRARGFYRDAFGWDVRELPEMSYTMVTSGPTTDQGMPSEPGFVNGGMAQRDANLAKQAVADMGFAACFKDSEGNVMGLWENATPS